MGKRLFDSRGELGTDLRASTLRRSSRNQNNVGVPSHEVEQDGPRRQRGSSRYTRAAVSWNIAARSVAE